MSTNFQVDIWAHVYLQPTIHRPQISSISYPYQFLFVPSAQNGMGREKIKRTLKHGGKHDLVSIFHNFKFVPIPLLTFWNKKSINSDIWLRAMSHGHFSRRMQSQTLFYTLFQVHESAQIFIFQIFFISIDFVYLTKFSSDMQTFSGFQTITI